MSFSSFDLTQLAEPLHHGDWESEYRWTREHASIFSVVGRTQLELVGRHRATFLNNFCTNDIVRMAAGRGGEAFLTSIQAKVLAWLHVYVEADQIWVDADHAGAEAVLGHLRKFVICEDVRFHNRTADFQFIHVAGPGAERAVASAFEVQPPAALHQHIRHPLAHIRRRDYLGMTGFDLLTTESDRLRASLSSEGVRPAGSLALESLRLEAGTPMYGRDLTEANLPQEVDRNDLAISFTKGCYLGQEPIARIHALGHVNRFLRKLECAGPEPIRSGARVLLGGTEVGRITSAAPALRRTLALAYVRRGHHAPGTRLQVELADDANRLVETSIVS
jgi:folate-binding protein YgfZ